MSITTEVIEKEIRHRAEQALSDGIVIDKLAFFHSHNSIRVIVSLDKLSDENGSVNIDECAKFSRNLLDLLELYEQETKISLPYSLEVSSCGAERELTKLDDFRRFQKHPMSIHYKDADNKLINGIFSITNVNGESLQLVTANVKANRKIKGMRPKADKLPRTIKFDQITKARIHLDF